MYRHGCFGHLRHDFGTGFDFGFKFRSPTLCWFEPFEWEFRPPRKSEYLEMLKKYRDELKKELEEIEKEIADLER